MGINQAEKTIDKRLVDMVVEHDRELKAMKTRQLIGGDNIPIAMSNVVNVTLTIPAGESRAVSITVTPTAGQLGLMEEAHSLFIYGTGLPDAQYLIPTGSSVSQEVIYNTKCEMREDYWRSNQTTGQKVYIATVTNSGVVTRQFMFLAQFYTPKVNLS